jgi:short-subunit dehydrogenase
MSGVTAAAGGMTRLLAVNVQTVVDTVEPILPRFLERGRGQVALMSSLGSFRGTPQAPAYCATKAAVRVWGEGLRARCMPHGVIVSVICPGFVATPLTAVNRFPMPLIMPPEAAAERIARGLARGQARIAFPRRTYVMTRLLAALPPSLGDRLLASYAGKE